MSGASHGQRPPHMGATGTPSADDAFALDTRLKMRARMPSSANSSSLLARGRAVTYRDANTPAGCVLRKYPDGHIETLRIDLSVQESGARR